MVPLMHHFGKRTDVAQRVLQVGAWPESAQATLQPAGWEWHLVPDLEAAQRTLNQWALHGLPMPDLLLLVQDPFDPAQRKTWCDLRAQQPQWTRLPAVLLIPQPTTDLLRLAREWQVQEIFSFRADPVRWRSRLQMLVEEARWSQEQGQEVEEQRYRIPRLKRLFDIVVAGSVLLLLSPLLLLIALLIKLESRGPVLYRSKRVGTGYRVFDFLKFRSMRPDADQLLKQMQHLDQYAQASPLAVATEPMTGQPTYDPADGQFLVSDDGLLPEETIRAQQKAQQQKAFIKLQNDPRITRVGQVIRRSSLDELPQLINVLRGDMSIVGNRPLPLYEAEQLTTDEWSRRFLAPAGITGLWQVTDRGKANVEADNRKRLDVQYAEEYSLWLDLKILLMTLPAMFQEERV